MIITLSMNPSIDRTISVPAFQYGGMNRVQSARDDACGKAVNLAIVAAVLGESARCIGLLPKENGDKIMGRLQAHGVDTRFIETPGRVRVNIKLFDESRGIITEINERGESVTEDQLEQLIELALDNAQAGDFLVLTGSMPPLCPPSFYQTLIQKLEGRCKCVLDAEGQPFSMGLRAKPFLIKPNLDELQMALGRTLGSVSEIAQAAKALQKESAELVAVTMGGDGAVMTDGSEMLFAPPIVGLNVRSTVGAGDSMIAGMLVGLSKGATLETVFQMGVAAAAASVVSEGTQLVDMDTYKHMRERTRIQRL